MSGKLNNILQLLEVAQIDEGHKQGCCLGVGLGYKMQWSLSCLFRKNLPMEKNYNEKTYRCKTERWDGCRAKK